MFDYSQLVDMILESDDYLSVLRETKNFNVKSFDEFAKIIADYDKRVKAKDIDTKLDVDKDKSTLKWWVNDGYMNDKDRTLSVQSFDNGDITCDKSVRFRAPGSVNLNQLVDVNQLLKMIDGYVYSLERTDDTEVDKEKAEEDDAFELDPSVKSILDKLKTDGESVINKFLSVPAFEYNGKQYKLEKGTLMASTEQELIAALDFPREFETYLYSRDKAGESLRRAVIAHFNKNGFKGDKAPQFRYDMTKSPYLYVPVGKLPVKKTTGPEARAILNYYDGNKVRFQPKEKD